MDTWATSSLTPQIAGRWSIDDDLFGRVFPMDLRPQAHEIIRTWLFYTVLRSRLEHGVLPWRHAAISGWILDPDRKKMSKSKGNVVTPAGVLAEFGSDAVRYWAASSGLGADVTYDPGQLRIGRRLAIKILNASRFVLGIADGQPASDGQPAARSRPDQAGESAITEPLDQAMLRRLGDVVSDCTCAFGTYDHSRALERAEEFFWSFCDDYLELVKARAYGERGAQGAASAAAALRCALSVLLRLFAPFLPFVTEEAWSAWQEGSVHRAAWPEAEPLHALAGGADAGLLDAASAAIGAIRKAKTQARVSMRTPSRRARRHRTRRSPNAAGGSAGRRAGGRPCGPRRAAARPGTASTRCCCDPGSRVVSRTWTRRSARPTRSGASSCPPRSTGYCARRVPRHRGGASTPTPRPRASTGAVPAAPSCSGRTRSSSRTAAGPASTSRPKATQSC